MNDPNQSLSLAALEVASIYLAQTRGRWLAIWWICLIRKATRTTSIAISVVTTGRTARKILVGYWILAKKSLERSGVLRVDNQGRTRVDAFAYALI